MKPHSVAVLQALFVVFLWGTSWVFVKIGLQAIPPITFAGLRYILAFICLLAVMTFHSTRNELRKIPGQGWLKLLILGILLYAGTQGAVFVALAYLPAVTVNLLWSFSSVTVTLLGVLWLSEKPAPLQWGGVTLALAGALIYFFPVEIPKGQSVGVVVALLGILANALASILGREINRSGNYGPLIVTIVSMGAGSIVLLLTGLILEGVPVIDLQSWGIILWLALVNTAFAFTLWNQTLRTLTAMESSIINGTMLIWIPIFAIIFLDEMITSKEMIGLVIAAAGTLLVQLRSPLVKKTLSAAK